MQEILRVNIHINAFLNTYFDLFEKTNKILCFQRDKRMFLCAVEEETKKIYLHDLLLDENDIVRQSRSAQKLINSLNGNLQSYSDLLTKDGYSFSVITRKE
jgi:hypothetical protein